MDFGKLFDVGIDGNNLKPYSFSEIKKIMDDKLVTSNPDSLQDHHSH